MKAVIFNLLNDFNLSGINKLLNKTVLQNQIDWLNDKADTIIVVGDYSHKRFRQKHTDIIFVKSEKKDIDLNLVQPYLDDRPFILITGEVLTNYPVSLLYQEHNMHKADISFLYSTASDFSGYYAMLSERKNLIDFVLNKKEFGNFIHNIFCVNPDLLTYINQENYLFFEYFLPKMQVLDKIIVGQQNKDFFVSLDCPASLYKANYELLHNEIFPISGNKIHHSYYGKNCEIEFSVKLGGKQFYGNNTRVNEQTNIKNNIVLDKVIIGAQCLIENSLIMNNVRIGNNCEIKNCIIGDNVVVEDNVRLPEYSVISQNSRVNRLTGVFNV